MKHYCHPNPRARGIGLSIVKEGCWVVNYYLWKRSGVFYWGRRVLP